jgi:periplasmic protein TonB
MRTFKSVDSPWHRLPWTLPTALLIWAVALWGLAYFMGKPSHRPMEPSPIDAQFIEQPASPATATVHQPKQVPPVIPLQTPVISKVTPSTEQPTPAQKTAVTTNTAGGVVSAAAVTEGKGSSPGNMYTSIGARAIIKPMPQIPDDLREDAFNSVALALFHIAIDGSVTVELAQPTPNPRLNRILLNSLKQWRFIPAIKNGKPVASTEEIVIKIEVK